MTFYEFGVKELVDRGMFENQATEVMDIVVEDSKTNPNSPNESMKDRWDDDVAGYPVYMKIILFMAIKPFALQYIKDNIPEAWFRPMFDDEHPLSKEFKAMRE